MTKCSSKLKVFAFLGLDTDVYPEIWNSAGVSLASYNDEYVNETTTQMLDNLEFSWDTNIEISNFDAEYHIVAFDNDDGEAELQWGM